MLDILQKAIEGRKYIAFTYSGIAREAQPVAIGESSTGKDVLRCFQTAGGHVKAGHEWDLCDVAKISGLSILDKSFFNPPPGYKKGDRHMVRIYAEL